MDAETDRRTAEPTAKADPIDSGAVASVDGYGDSDHADRHAVPAEPPTPPSLPTIDDTKEPQHE